jgi:hypothetical protein
MSDLKFFCLNLFVKYLLKKTKIEKKSSCTCPNQREMKSLSAADRKYRGLGEIFVGSVKTVKTNRQKESQRRKVPSK